MKLLVVDDENLIARGIAHVIEQFGGPFDQVDIAYSCEGALKQMEQVRYDLVITDISMPGASGLELIKAAQGGGLCENFCILSGYSEFEYARSAIRLGVEDYLLKPVDKEKLRELLEAISKKVCARDVSRRRERDSVLTDCLFGRLEDQELGNERPLLLTVAETLFHPADPALGKKLKEYRGRGLADHVPSIHHLPVFVVFSRPCAARTLGRSLLEGSLVMFFGTAAGQPATGAQLRELYERALHAALCGHCFLGRRYMNGDALSVPRSAQGTKEFEKLLLRQLDANPTQGQMLFYRQCWRALAAKPAAGDKSAQSPYAAQMIELVEQGFDRELTLNSAARTIGLSPEYAGKLFRTEMGVSFSEYLNRYRIAKILEYMLRDPRLSFEQLAPSMGFPDLRNFYRVFKRIMQTTPGKYRDSLCPPKDGPGYDDGE